MKSQGSERSLRTRHGDMRGIVYHGTEVRRIVGDEVDAKSDDFVMFVAL